MAEVTLPLSRQEVSVRLLRLGSQIEDCMHALKLIYQAELGDIITGTGAHTVIPRLAQLVIDDGVSGIFTLKEQIDEADKIALFAGGQSDE